MRATARTIVVCTERSAWLALGMLMGLWIGEARAHDHNRPEADAWYASLKVPADGLVLPKGASCCDRTDCKQRVIRYLGPGRYEVLSDYGRWLPFTERIRITDPAVLATNPYFAATVCVYGGHPVCWVPGKAGM